MKININRRLIQGIIDSANPEFIYSMDEKIQNIIVNVVDDLSNRCPYVSLNNTILQPVNEVFTGGFSSNAQFCYFLGVENTQIEMNTIEKKHFWKSLKRKFLNAWYKTRSVKKRKRKKDKDIEQENVPESQEKKTASNYKLVHLKLDIQDALLNFLSETSIVYYFNKYLKIIGKDDFGTEVEVLLYIVLFDSEKNIYKMYNSKKNKFLEIDFKDRFKNLIEKSERVGDNFVNMIKIFNSIYKLGLDDNANQILIESLLYNVPDKLFEGDDIYSCFIKIVNYLRITNATNFVSIANSEKTIFKDILFYGSSSAVDFTRFLRLFDNIEIE